MAMINSGNVPLLDKYGNDKQWKCTVIGHIWQCTCHWEIIIIIIIIIITRYHYNACNYLQIDILCSFIVKS
jgi:hypothetical protein